MTHAEFLCSGGVLAEMVIHMGLSFHETSGKNLVSGSSCRGKDPALQLP